MKIQEIIETVQKTLGVQVDGKAGPETWSAIYNAIVKPAAEESASPNTISPVDDRSEKNIATLHPEVRPIARALVQKAAANGIQIKVISGLRSYAEQDALYAQGRTTPGNIVTNVKGGYSNHNFGIAFDIGVFSGTRYLPESPQYQAVGALGMDLGLEWGGSWTSFVDQPHFQLRPGWARDIPQKTMLAELRQKIAENAEIYA